MSSLITASLDRGGTRGTPKQSEVPLIHASETTARSAACECPKETTLQFHDIFQDDKTAISYRARTSATSVHHARSRVFPC
jgi:hypothetical protein